MYGGHLIVKAFGREEKAVEAFERENEKLYNAGWKSQFLSGLMMPVMNFVGNLGYVVICMVGASMAAGGTMTIGGIQAFIQYVRSFTQPINQLANISNQLQMTVAAAERISSSWARPRNRRRRPSSRPRTWTCGETSFSTTCSLAMRTARTWSSGTFPPR